MPNFSVLMRFVDQASRPLKRVQEASNQLANANEKLSGQVKAANAAMVTFAAATDVAVGITIAKAAELENSLARLATVTQSTSQSQITSLANAEAAARKFSESFTASTNSIIQAQFQLATAGVPVEEQIVGSQAAFKLAEATMGDFTNAAQLLGSFLNTFGRNVEFNYLTPALKMEAITDRLSTAVQRFQVTLPVLAESFKFVVGPASQLNLSLSELSVAIGVLNTAGFRGTLAGTALSNMFNKVDRAVEKLDLDPSKFTDLNGDLKDLRSFLEEVNRALADKTPLEAQTKLIEVFDIRAGRVVKTLINNVEALKTFTAEMEVSRGATERMADIMQSTASAELQKMLNAFTNLATEIGKQFLPVMKFVAQALNTFAHIISEVVAATGPLIPILLTTAAVATTLTVAIKALGFAMAALSAGAFGKAITTTLKLTGVLTLLRTLLGSFAGIFGAIIAGFTGFLSIGSAFKSLLGFVVSFGSKLLTLTGVIGLVAAAGLFLGDVFGRLYRWFTSGGEEEHAKNIDALRSQYQGLAGDASALTAELNRINEINKSGIKSAFLGGKQGLGDLNVSKRTKELFDAGKSLSDAANQAFSESGGFEGVIADFAKQLGVPIEEMEKFRKSLVEVRSVGDREFSQLSDSAKALEVARGFVQGLDIAFRSLGGGTQQAGEQLKKLVQEFDVFQAAAREGNSGARDAAANSLFEIFSQGSDLLRQVDIQPVQELVNLFDQLRATGEQIDGGDERFLRWARQLGQVGEAVKRAAIEAGTFNQVLISANSALTQMGRSARGVETIVKNASLGAGDFDEAFTKAGNNIEESKKSLEAFIQLLPSIEQQLANASDSFKLTNEFQELKKLFESRDELILKARIEIDDAEAQQEAIRSFAAIASQLGPITKEMQQNIKGLARDFGEVVKGALTGAFAASGKSVSDEMARAFKQNFFNQITGDIQTLLAPKLAPELGAAVKAAKDAIQGFTAEDLLKGLESGELARLINQKVFEAVPALKGILGADLFNFEDIKSGLDDATKAFRDLTTDTAVKLVTANNENAAILRRLQAVINEGPGQSAAALNEQADRLRGLLLEANRLGADAAIRPIESALKTVLDQLNAQGPKKIVEDIATATERGKVAIVSAADVFRSAVELLVPSAQRFIETIQQGFQGLTKVEQNVGVTNQDGEQTIKIEFGPRQLSVDVTGTTSSGFSNEESLSEDEIRKIIDEAREELRRELDESLVKLESELRGR